MLLVVLDALLGMLLLGTIAALAGARRRAPASARATGWALVAIPLPAAVGVHLLTHLSPPVDQTLFIAGVAGFAVGAALLLGRDDEDWREPEDDSPPWWPEFERAFDEYANRSRRPLARV
jgi:hypothetical protein